MGAFDVLRDILLDVSGLVQIAIPIAFGGAILGFFFGIAKYVFSSGDEDSKAQGKQIMIWGLVALFIMVSVFGIIRLFQRTLNVQDVNVFPVPSVIIPR